MQTLLNAYNLTAALREHYTNVTAQIIKQEMSTATTEEQELLQISEPQSWIREVYLQGDGANVVLARVVAPLATYNQFKAAFDTLGNKFLGESFLYQIPHTRTPFAYKQVQDKWQRSSIFSIKDYKLLVTELFLKLNLDLLPN